MTLSRTERLALAILLAIFTWFTWRGLTMHYSGDDMMNMTFAWDTPPWRLAQSVICFWVPVYRPLGAAIYRSLYETLGFNPDPLNVLTWLLLAVNVVLGYRFFRTLTESAPPALAALAVTLVHPNFQDLYLSSGTIYDRLWYMFTALGLTCYVQWRRSDRGLTGSRQAVLLLLSILSMASKESGVALPVLMGLYEVLFHFPGRDRLIPWLRTYGPLFLVLALVTLIDIRRVNTTPEIASNGLYHPSIRLSLWLDRVAAYFSVLTAGHVPFTRVWVAAVLCALAALGLLLRSRVLLYGLIVFVVTISPVAFISPRPGYVLYVPELGLGLVFAALLASACGRLPLRGQYAVVGAVTLAASWFFMANWPPPFDPSIAPEKRLTEQFQREFPAMTKGARLLFVTDDFPPMAWDLAFNLRLLYHDRSLVVHRLIAPKDQQPPDPNNLTGYDHVFTLAAGQYVELDRRDIQRSIRLNILANQALGPFMDIANRDHSAYVVSGLMDGPGTEPSRWTTPELRLKFRVAPGPADFSLKFWVPDFVAKSGTRTLSLRIGSRELASIPLTQDGMNEFRTPVPAELINAADYTLVDLVTTNPWKDGNNLAYGVVLLKAGFEDRATIKP